MHITIADLITIISTLVAIEMAIGHGTIALTNALPEAWIPRVQAWCNILAGVGSILVAALSRMVGAIALLAVVVALAAPAMAQQPPRPRPLIQFPQIGGQQQGSEAATTTAGVGTSAGAVDKAFADFHTQIQKLEKQIVDEAIADLSAAITDATNRKDEISLPCWNAQIAFLKMLPVEWETPPAKIGIALGIQIQRDLLNTITGNDASSLKVACAALLGDQLRIITNVAALIGMKVATGGLAP